MSEENDKIVYFAARGRAEPTRMLYALANQPLIDERIVDYRQWQTELKAEQPIGQLPVYKCKEGTLVLSDTIAKYVAKKFGLIGETAWEEAINDMVAGIWVECHNQIGLRIYHWKFFKFYPEPENSSVIIKEVKETILQRLKYVQSVAEQRGNRFIVGDQIMLADVCIFCLLEYASNVFPDIQSLSPWVEKFMANFRGDDIMKGYLAQRPPSQKFGL